jgi:acetyltransferase-like isoleucine patch superfamily enzyme
MSLIKSLVLKIKRAETPAWATLKRTLQRVQRVEIPAPRWLFRPLYQGHIGVKTAAGAASRVLYYQPMFRALCEQTGPGLYLYQGIPYVAGGLTMRFGEGCKLSAQTSLVAGHVCDAPRLEVGDHSNIGPGVVISASKLVRIGSHVRISSGVMIADNPGHPLDPVARRTRPVSPDQVRPVIIEDDVWIGSHAIILPGVTLGRGAIVGAGSVVTRDVAPGDVVAGNPAQVIRRAPGDQPPEASAIKARSAAIPSV